MRTITARLVVLTIWLCQQSIIVGAEREVQATGGETSAGTTELQQSETGAVRGIAPDANGVVQCPLYIFVPFTTHNGNATRSITGDLDRGNPSLTVLAAAVLAAEHFNSRNASVVPELADLMINCSSDEVRIDIENSFAFDSGMVGHAAARQFLQQSMELGKPPCAIAGPMSDGPATELSTLALGLEIPLVVVQSHNERVVLDSISPYTSMVFPDTMDLSMRAAQLLQLRQRTDFVSFVYTVSDTNIVRREIWTMALSNANMTYESYGVLFERAQPFGDDGIGAKDTAQSQYAVNAGLAYNVLRSVKERGFRTILLCMDDPTTEFPPFADAADELNMNNGDYFWLWLGVMDPVHLSSPDERYHKLLQGSAELLPLEQFWLSRAFDEFVDPFDLAWNQSTSATTVDRLNAINPMVPGDVGYEYAKPDFFQTHAPDWGAGFMYDAVMSIGIGACLASRISESENGNITTSATLLTGAAHLQGIRSVDFSGATGTVKFVNAEGRAGARVASSVVFGVGNFVPSTGKERKIPFLVTDLLLPNTSDWTPLTPFIYADGRTVPPKYLRDPPQQNYISRGLKVFGLTLMSTVLLVGVMTIGWVWWHRKHRVLAAGQPLFLCTMAFGCIIEAGAIFARSFDEADGWSEAKLSAACMATPWLVSIGHIVVYGSLFSKLWRVNKVLAFARRRIHANQVLWPSVVLMAAAVVVLSIWTATDSLTWERSEVNAYTGESIGSCDSEYMTVFAPILLVILITPTFLTLLMAWKTKDVSDEFSEAKWVWILIVVQLEVLLVAVPTVIILRGVSADGRYLGITFILWVLPMSTLILIMTPKVLAHRRMINGHLESRPKRGEKLGTVKVSGLTPTLNIVGNSTGSTSSYKLPADSHDESSYKIPSDFHEECPETGRASFAANYHHHSYPKHDNAPKDVPTRTRAVSLTDDHLTERVGI